ncbi:hypothetical protein GINT2_001907 [Glugoides intestinalis]
MPRKKKGLENPYKSTIFESELYKEFEASKHAEMSENTEYINKANENESFSCITTTLDGSSLTEHSKPEDGNTAFWIERTIQKEENDKDKQNSQKYDFETVNSFKFKLPTMKSLSCLKVRIPKGTLNESASINNSQGIVCKEDSGSIERIKLKSLFTEEHANNQAIIHVDNQVIIYANNQAIIEENNVADPVAIVDPVAVADPVAVVDPVAVADPVAVVDHVAIVDHVAVVDPVDIQDISILGQSIISTDVSINLSEFQNSNKSEISSITQEIHKDYSSPLPDNNFIAHHQPFVYASNQNPNFQSVITKMHNQQEDNIFYDKQDLDSIEDAVSLSFGSETASDDCLKHENPSFLLSSNTQDPDNSCSFDFPSEKIDWSSIMPVITYAMSLCVEIPIKLTPKKSEEKTKDVKLISKKETIRPRKETDQSIFFESTYLYFLKKVCNLSKRECAMYGMVQNKMLMERATKNKAELLKTKKHYALKEGRGVRIFSSIKLEEGLGKEEDLESVFLEKINRISPIVLPEYEKNSFEYMVYKYGENLETISKKLNMDIKDVIVIYYLKYYGAAIKIEGPLLEKYVDDEWCIMDRILFEENFMKYTTKFSKYMMNKSEEELKIYYKFYLKNYLPVNWTEEERSLFARLIGSYKKDWDGMAKYFQTKNANELKVYYSSYFKKLDEEERIKEQELAPGDTQLHVSIQKKRGRKPNLMKAVEKEEGS